MKKLFSFIGMFFLMFAFVMGASPPTETDIGEKFECETLQIDQMAIIDNVFTCLENEKFIIENEAKVKISTGVLFSNAMSKSFSLKKNAKRSTKKLDEIACNYGNDAKSALVNSFTSTTFNQGSICGILSDDGNIYTTLNGVNNNNERTVFTVYSYFYTDNGINSKKTNNHYLKVNQAWYLYSCQTLNA